MAKSFSDWSNEKRKKTSENTASNSTNDSDSTNTSSSKAGSFSEWSNAKRNSKDSTDINQWTSSVNNLLDQYSTIASTWHSKDDPVYDDYYNEKSRLLSYAQNYRNQYKGDAEALNYINDVVDRLSSASTVNIAKYYSNWNSAEDYNSSKLESQRRNKYSKFDESYIQRLARNMSPSDDDYDWLKEYIKSGTYELDRYSALSGNSDFAQNSKYNSTANGQEKFNIFTGTYTNTGFDDITYDYINRNEDARGRQMEADVQSNASLFGTDNSFLKQMTDSEISVFNYLYKTKGADEAYSYVNKLSKNLTARQRQEDMEWWANAAKESPVASSIFSVLESPLKGISYIGQTVDYLTDGEIDQNAGYNKFSYLNSAIREEVSSTITNSGKWGGVGSFLYQTGMSMGDFLFNTAVTGGNEWLNLAVMGTGAAADTVISSKDKGLNDNQAFWLGTIAGLAEIATEKVSIETLLKPDFLADGAFNFIKKNFLAEGFEEVGSDIINLIADLCISGDKAEMRQDIAAYIADGKSEGEAKALAIVNQLKNAGLDFLGGALSGGIMAGGRVVGYNAFSGDYKKTYGADIDALVSESLEITPDNALAKKIQSKLDAGKKISGGEIRRLVETNESNILSNDKTAIQNAAAQQLTSYGETGNVNAIAQSITKYVSGEKLTQADRRNIFQSKYGQRVVNELNTENIKSGEYNTAWAEQLDTSRINPDVYSRLVQEAQIEPESASTEQTSNNIPEPINEQQEPTEDMPEPATGNNVPNSVNDTNVGNKQPESNMSEKLTSSEIPNNSEANTPADSETGKTVTVEEASKKYGAQAGAFLHTYQKGQDVQKYDQAYQAAYDYGKTSVPFEAVNGLDSVSYLTEAQRELAYEAGKAAADTEASTKQQNRMQRANGKSGRRIGTVKGEGVTIADLKTTLNDQQGRAYRVLSTIAEVTGIDIVLYKSAAGEDGKFRDAQGAFKHASPDTIYIDLNAGLSNIKDVNDIAKYAMLRTFSHEFTHFVEYWNPVQYNELRKVVFSEITKRGENVNDLIEAKMDETGLSYEKASREVVAEALTDILPDSKFAQNMAENHKSLFNKLLEKLKDFVADIRAYFDTIGKNRSREAEALKEQIGDTIKYVDSVIYIFNKAAEGAVDTFQKAYAVEEAPARRTVGRDYLPANDFTTREEPGIDLRSMAVTRTEPERRTVGRDFLPANDFTSREEPGIDLKKMAVMREESTPTETQVTEEESNRRTVSRDDLPANDFTSITEPGINIKDMAVMRAETDTETATATEEAPAAAEPEIKTTTSKYGYTITDNPQYNSVEVKFDGKPSETVRNALKAIKFRWNGKKGVWYGKATHEHVLDVLDSVYEVESKSTAQGDLQVEEAKPQASKPFFGDEIINDQAVSQLAEDIQNDTAPKQVVDAIESLPEAPAESAQQEPEQDAITEAFVSFNEKEMSLYNRIVSGVGNTIENGFGYSAHSYTTGNGKVYRAEIHRCIHGNIPVFDARALYNEDFKSQHEAAVNLVLVARNNRLLEAKAEKPEAVKQETAATPAATGEVKEEKKNGRHDGVAQEGKTGNDDGRVDSGSGDVRRGNSGRGTTGSSSKGQQQTGDLQEHGDSGENDVPESVGSHRTDEADGNGRNDSNGNGSGLQSGIHEGSSDGRNGEADTGIQEDVPVKQRNSRNYRITEDIDSIRPNFDDNVNAIKLVKQLISENRAATEEERAILAKYKGWGALKERVLGNGYYPNMLKKLLTPEEYETARDSVLNAHYTSTKVISGIYRAIQRMGFKGGNILEPSMGVGNFFGMLPQELSDKSSLYGVELDKITGTIAQNLYPDAKISVAGFQDILFGDGTFDLVVGNVPFSNEIKIPYRGQKFNLHDFFFVKALDETRTGGVLALITSTGTLDKLSGKTQTAIAQRANLIAAFRLPDNAFKSNAGTSVTTDLIFLQKKGNGIADNGVSFTEIGNINGIPVNEYYVEHPENILGQLAYEKGMYAAERTVVHATEDFEARFNAAIDSLPKNIMNVKANTTGNVSVKKRGQKSRTTFAITDEGVFLVDSDGGKTQLSRKQENIVKKYTEIKNLYFNTSESEQNGNIEAAEEYRGRLNKAYDDFKAKYGTLDGNKRLLGKDDEFLRVSGLELVDKEGNVSKSAIFERPTMYRSKKTSASSSSEALSIVLNENGRVDIDEIAKLTGKTREETAADLSDEIILTPDGEYVLIPQYLSGNIYQKLDAVKGKKGFERQEELLKTALPKPKTAQNIDAEISSHWIPAKYMTQFVKEEFRPYGRFEVKYLTEAGKWDFQKFDSPVGKWKTNRVGASDLLLATMNNKGITVYDYDPDGNKTLNEKDTKIAQNKQNDLRRTFREWVFRDSDRRTELENTFNRTLNAYAPMNFNALADKLDYGVDPNSPIKLRDYQKAAVARIMFGGNTLLHHGVGTGKTATMITAAHVLKSAGISHKPMFVVPNGKTQDFKREILNMYPRANILALDADLLSPKELQRTKALIATNDWDYVIIHRSGFQKIGVSPETTAAFIEQQLEDLEKAIRESGATEKNGTRAEKALIAKKKNLEEKLKKILEAPKDDSSPFEKMGIDALFVDEAHNFKKVGFATTQEISGVDSSTNALTTDLYMKENWLRERGGRIVLATATPITNTVSEMYNMTLHVNPDILREAGVYAFDGWLNTFGDMRAEVEIASDGKTFRMKQRIQDFKNGNELISLYRQFADVKQTKDVVEGLPEANEITVICKGSDIHQRLLDQFADRMARVGRGSKDDNALNVNNDARNAATDLRMVHGLLQEMYPGITVDELDLPDSKVNMAVANIVDNYHSSKKNKGTQLVFLDSGMGRGKSKRYTFNLYGDLISKLVKSGIPRNEIADIGDYDGDANRQKLYDLVNAGTIRVLIGSTQKMGEGVNVQKKIVALHDLSVPMRADNLEQRHGRGIRHGNENKTVKIYKYIQEQSYDSYLWQMIERKSKYMAQALNGGDATDLEEIAAVTVNAQQSKALATGNPAIMEKFKLENEVSTLRTLENAYNQETRDAARSVSDYKESLARYENKLKSAEKIVSVLAKNRKPDFEMTVGKKTYDNRKDAAEAFEIAYRNNTIKDIGSIYGLKISRYSNKVWTRTEEGIIFNDNTDTFVELGDSAEGNITRLVNGLYRVENLPSTIKKSIENAKISLADAENTASRGDFPQAKELNEKLERLEEINRELGIKSDTVEFNVSSAESEDSDDVQEQSRSFLEDDTYNEYDEEIQYSKRVDDTKTLKMLNDQLRKGEYDPVNNPDGGYIKVYRSAQIIDGGMYAPMNAVDRDENGKNKTLGYRSEIRQWEMSTESPEIAQKYMDEHPDAPYAKFDLDGVDNKTNGVAYNPYIHLSNLVLNDQFAAAYRRNLVTVEYYVPVSEIGAYQAKYAKDGTGWVEWKPGGVAGKLMKVKPEYTRRLFVSRYAYPVRIVPNTEVASLYKEYLDGTDIKVPWNVVTPDLRRELVNAGVGINYKDVYSSTDKKTGEKKYLKYAEVFPDEADVQYQQRTSPMTDREILSIAASEVNVSDLSDGEKDALRIFQQRLTALYDLEQKRAEEGQLYKEQQFGSMVDREAAKQTLNRMHVLDQQIMKAGAEVLKVERAEVLKRVLQKARKVVEAQERQHGKELLARYRDRQKNSAAIKKYRERIKTDTDTLKKWILHPNNKNALQHVPDALKNSIIPFLTSIDFTSKQQLRGGAATQADREFVKQLTKLKAAIKQNIDVHGMYSGYNDLPEGFMGELQKFIDSAQVLADSQEGQFVINRMTSDELKTLSKLVRVVKKLIVNMNAFHQNAMFQHTYEAGDSSIEFMSQIKNPAATGTVSEFLLWQQIRPAYAFERFGDGGKAIFDEFRQGQATLAFNTNKIKEFADKAYTEAEVKAWEKETKTFDLGGDSVKIPVSYLMGLYELSKRPQALGHLLGAGIRVATYKNGKEKISDVGHALTPGDISTMIKALTPRQKEVADSLQKFMAEQGGKWGNYVSVARFGEELFGEKNYYPINSDGRHLQATADEHPSAASLYALLNMSFTKELTEDANNRIILYSIFDVFSNHMASMAQYNAFALPILDSLKWFNYQQVVRDENGSKTITGSVREEMDRAYGTPEESRPGSGRRGYAESFVMNIIKAFNGTETQGVPTDTQGLNGLHRYNMAQVAYNFRVVVQQPLAITRAGMLVDYKNIIKGLTLSPAEIKANIAEMQKYSGIAAWKALGFYDVNISRGLTDIIKHNKTTLDKIGDVGMAGAEFADTVTWAAMWSACKEQVLRDFGKPNTEEYFAEVTKLFEEVVYKTQVVDSVLTKNEFLRSKGWWARAIGSFMSEPTTTASMLIDAYYKYSMDMQRGLSRQQAWKLNGKNIVRTAYVYAIGSLLLAAVTAAADAWRDDDDYQTFSQKWIEAFGGNLIDEANPLNKLPILRDFYEMVKSVLEAWGVDTYGNEPRSVIFQWRDYLVKASEIFHDKITGEKTNYTWYGGAYKLLQALSGITGLPMADATRELVSAWNNVIGAMAPSLKVKTYDPGDRNSIKYAYQDGYLSAEEATAKLIETGQAEDENDAYWLIKGFDGDSKYDGIKAAIDSNDYSAFKTAKYELTSHGVEESNVSSQAKKYIKENYTGAEMVKMIYEYATLTSEDIRGFYEDGTLSYTGAVSYLKKSAGKSDDEANTAVGRWKFKLENPNVKWSDDQIEKYNSEVKAQGISVKVYDNYLTRKKSCTGTDADGDGKADSGTKKAQILDAIDELNISYEQKDFLYYLEGYAESKIYEAPWHN